MSALIEIGFHFSVPELRKAFEALEEAKCDRFTEKTHISMGADGITYGDFKRNLDRNIREISHRVLRGRYRFYPLRERDVDKDPNDKSKGERTLSIARIRDILVQKQLYNAIYDRTEDWFNNGVLDRVSVAYRRGKSTHDAIRGIWNDYQRGFEYVLDADIKGFFDNLNHQYLMQQVDKLLGLVYPQFLGVSVT